MALLHCDGFDHYGLDEDNMLDGVYAELSMVLTTSIVRTGTHSLSGGGIFRWVLPAGRETVGAGYGLYLSELPSQSDRVTLYQSRDADNNPHLSVTLVSTGALRVRRGTSTGGTLLHETEPVIGAAAWHHIETRVFHDNSTGTVEVRVNGETVIDLSGVDTVNTADPVCRQMVFGETSSSSATVYIDDFFVWDDQGDFNNDFLGDHRVRMLSPTADTVADDWALTGAASGYDCINDAAPDDASTYIAASAADDVSEFEFADVPDNVSSIAALVAVARMRKTDAGTCNVQMSLVSSMGAAAGADRPITEEWAYWRDVIEADPDTGAPWLLAAANAALLRFERTA